MQSAAALTSGLFDYAGLFPPTGAPMPSVVEAFAGFVSCADAWMLGRLVVPASRLDEFESAAVAVLQGENVWRLSALLPPAGDAALDDAVERVLAFNSEYAGRAVVDSVEFKGDDPAAIDASAQAIPEEIRAFVEIPVGDDPRGLIAAVKSAEACAKIRCGGVTADLIPRSADVARFLHACASSRTAFKATAGLHHPLRAEQHLTYEASAPRGVMHGFLNVVLATACAMHDESLRASDLVPILEADDLSSFGFGETGVVALGHELSNEQITACREQLFLSIGSCSFDEPRDDLRRLGLL